MINFCDNIGSRNNNLFYTLDYWGFNVNTVHIEEIAGQAHIILNNLTHRKSNQPVTRITIIIDKSPNWPEICNLLLKYSNEIETYIIEQKERMIRTISLWRMVVQDKSVH